MTFDDAFEDLLRHEGDYSDHPADRGGRTRYGITESVARAAGYQGDMQNFPLSLAKAIYRRDYWDKVRADELPERLRYLVFDAAVNSGVGHASRWLQMAVDVKVDGSIGPVTLAAVRQADVEAVRAKISAYRLRLMAMLPSWPTFGRGWARRVADILEA